MMGHMQAIDDGPVYTNVWNLLDHHENQNLMKILSSKAQ
jgi:hypothetical protein